MLAGPLAFTAEEPKDLMGFHLFEPPSIGLLPKAAPPTLRELVALPEAQAAPRRCPR